METTVKQVSPKDQIPYHCRLCGACCRDLEDQLMLEPLDAYRLGQHLQKMGEQIDIEDVYAKYAHAEILAEGCPVFLVNTVGVNHSCAFLKENRCAIYAARPRACRMYPFSVIPSQAGKRFQYYQCLDAHSDHFSGENVCARDWIRENLNSEDRIFLEKEAGYMARLGNLLHRAGLNRQKEWLFSILFYRYYNYDLEQPFLAQYERNHKELLNQLSRNVQKEM